MGRKVTIEEGLRELFSNLSLVYACYALIQWETNPLKWDFGSQCFAIFMACIYFPYRDNQRWKRDKDKEE